MMNLKDKLKSRKFWISVILVLMGVIMIATGDSENGMKVLVIGGAGYLSAEGVADVVSRLTALFEVPNNVEEEPPEDDCPSSDEVEG